MSWLESFAGAVFGASTVVAALSFTVKKLIDHGLQRNLKILDAELKELADENKRLRDEQADVRAVVKRYSRVILLSATDLQDRLWHLCSRKGVRRLFEPSESGDKSANWPMTREHYLTSTMYCFARYFCWIEILKHNVSLLEFNDDEDTRAFNHHVKRIERMLSATSLQKCADSSIIADEPVFQFMQMEIGEALRVPVGDDSRSMPYHEFRTNYAELLSKNEGMTQLEKLVSSAAVNNAGNFCHLRLRLLQNALVDLVLFLNTYNRVVSPVRMSKLDLEQFDHAKFNEKWPAFTRSQTADESRG